MTDTRKRDLLRKLVELLSQERGDMPLVEGLSTDELWDTFRALVNTRPPRQADPYLLSLQDELLKGVLAEKGVTALANTQTSELDVRLHLWRGDICTLEVDAIVNAANSQMLGCWVPGHHCIDNAIHTFAGIQLRLECAHIMAQQGHDEPTGSAKITGGWNLPARHVLHTVGPIADGNPTQLHRAQLASCYTSCLDLAAKNGLHSVAFCCISTGVFGFPQRLAAPIAVDTVRDWLAKQDASLGAPFDMDVVFNVFSEVDEKYYRELL